MLYESSICNKLKSGIHAFLAGSILSAIICFGDIAFCFFRARQIQKNEAAYIGLQGEDMDPVNSLDDDDQYFTGQPDADVEYEDDNY